MPISDLLNVFPSRSNLGTIKSRLTIAQKSLKMLQQHCAAVDLKVRDLKQQLIKLEDQQNYALQEAVMHVARARYYGIQCEPYLLVQTNKNETISLEQAVYALGINIPIFHFKTAQRKNFHFGGLAGGGEEARLAQQKFLDLLDLMISIDTLKYSLISLDTVVRQMKKRCNAVEHVIIPKIEAASNYIKNTLNEQELEDFHRLKYAKAKLKQKQIKTFKTTTDKTIRLEDFFNENEFMQPENIKRLKGKRVDFVKDSFEGRKAVVKASSSKFKLSVVLNGTENRLFVAGKNFDYNTPYRCKSSEASFKHLHSDEGTPILHYNAMMFLIYFFSIRCLAHFVLFIFSLAMNKTEK